MASGKLVMQKDDIHTIYLKFEYIVQGIKSSNKYCTLLFNKGGWGTDLKIKPKYFSSKRGREVTDKIYEIPTS